MHKITTLDGFRDTWVFRFPSHPKNALRVVRHDGAVVAVDIIAGRVYMTNMDGKARRVSYLHRTKQDLLSVALRKLGVMDPAVTAMLAREHADTNRAHEANWMLSNEPALRKLGVPYTKSQIRRLSEMVAKLKP